MPVSRRTILKVRRKQFSRFGFDDLESVALAKSDYKFTDRNLKARILRRNRKVTAITEANRTITLEEAVRQAVLEDPLLKPTVKKEPESKSVIMRLLRRLR